MAEHRVPKGNIIYIIPTDELFIKYKNNEAFIDEYGRLMNRKPHGVVMQPAVTDVPDKKKIVRGIYDIPEDAGTIRVKITDLLAESLEMEVE